MIQGNVQDIEKVLPYVSERLQKALQYIAQTDFSKLPNGKVVIEEGVITAGINTYDTEPKADRRAEKHTKFIDVQFVAQGEETIWYAPYRGNAVTEDRMAKDDVAFYADPAELNCANLKAGDFCILFPWEMHRPNCDMLKTTFVQKVVVKVLAD